MSIIKFNSQKPQEFSLGSVFKLLYFHKAFVSLFILISLIAVGVYSYIMPETYEATASIIPPDENNSGGGLTSFLQSLSGGIAFGNYGQGNKVMLYQEFIKSREAAKLIVDTLNLLSNPKFKEAKKEALYYGISNMLDVVLKRSGLITVTAATQTHFFPVKTDKQETARLAADIANAAVKALDRINKNQQINRSRAKQQYIQKALVYKNNSLNEIDSTLQAFRQKNKVLILDDQSKSVLSNAISVGSELAKAEVDLNLKMLEFEPNSPMLKVYKEKVNTLRSQFEKMQKGGGSSDEFSIPLTNVPKLIKDYTTLVREQKVLEQVKMYLETQKYQESIQELNDVPTIDVLDQARPSEFRVSPNRVLMLFLTLVLSSLIVTSIITGSAIRKSFINFKKAEEQKESEK